METQSRGSPKLMDGYLIEKGGGRWQIEAGGRVIGERCGYAVALDIAKEHTRRPIWKIALGHLPELAA
jgi:hypothetical protein